MSMETGISLSLRTTEVSNKMFWTPLPSASLLVTGTGLSEDQVKRGLRDLTDQKFVEIHWLGCLLPPVPLVSWTESGLDHFEANEWERNWCGADGLGTLALYDFAKVEAVKAVAPFYATGGWRLERILSFERQPMIAAVAYRHLDHHAPAYLVFCWASMLENQRELCERLEALADAMQAVSVDPTNRFWPAGIALLAASEWGAARALCLAHAVLSGWVQAPSIAGWYYGSGGWHVSDAVSAPTGAPPEEMPQKTGETETGKHPDTQSLGWPRWPQAGRAADPGGHSSLRLRRSLPGPHGRETRRDGHQEAVEAPGENGTDRGRHEAWPGHEEEEVAKGIPVTLSERRQGGHRYAATLAGRVQFCYVHGGKPEDLYRRTNLGRLKTLIREKVLLHLLTLSWMVHILYAPGVSPVDLFDLATLARNWRKLR